MQMQNFSKVKWQLVERRIVKHLSRLERRTRVCAAGGLCAVSESLGRDEACQWPAADSFFLNQKSNQNH